MCVVVFFRLAVFPLKKFLGFFMPRHQNRPRHPWVENNTAHPYWPIHWGRYGHSKINSIVKELHRIFLYVFRKSRRLIFYRHVFSLPLPVTYWSRLNQECGKPASTHKEDKAAGIRKSTFFEEKYLRGGGSSNVEDELCMNNWTPKTHG